MLRIQCLTIDAHDPGALATFWEGALGWRRTLDDGTEVVIEPPAGSPEDGVAADLLFIKVREAKVLKNRLHLDLRPDDQDAEVLRLIALGARPVDIGQGDAQPCYIDHAAFRAYNARAGGRRAYRSFPRHA